MVSLWEWGGKERLGGLARVFLWTRRLLKCMVSVLCMEFSFIVDAGRLDSAGYTT